MGRIKGVSIIEFTPKKELEKEKVILGEFLQMIFGQRARHRREQPKDKRSFFEILKKESDLRYVHVSCHGDRDKDGVYIVTPRNGKIRPTDFEKGILTGRYVTLSGCYLGRREFVEPFIVHTGAEAIIAPQREIPFPDSAIFWVIFYFILFTRKLTFGGSFGSAKKLLRKLAAKGGIQMWQ